MITRESIYFFSQIHRSRDVEDLLLVLQAARVDDELFSHYLYHMITRESIYIFFTNSLIKGCGRFATSPTGCQG